MTARHSPGHGSSRAPISRIPHGLPHTPPPQGASLVALHVAGLACDCPDCREATRQTLALDRLADYLDREGGRLEQILRLLGRWIALADLGALKALHIEPSAEAEALAQAERLLEHVVEALAAAPSYAEAVGPVHPGDATVVESLDQAIRWAGARTQDVLSALRYARMPPESD